MRFVTKTRYINALLLNHKYQWVTAFQKYRERSKCAPSDVRPVQTLKIQLQGALRFPCVIRTLFIIIIIISGGFIVRLLQLEHMCITTVLILKALRCTKIMRFLTVFETWHDLSQCECFQEVRSRSKDQRVRTHARRSLCAAVAEGSQSGRYGAWSTGADGQTDERFASGTSGCGRNGLHG